MQQFDFNQQKMAYDSLGQLYFRNNTFQILRLRSAALRMTVRGFLSQ